MDSVDDVLTRLRRYPDVEAVNLYAVDAADRLILDTAADAIAAAGSGEIAVIGDAYGALTLGVDAMRASQQDATSQRTGGLSPTDLARPPRVRVHQDLLTGELALAANARELGRDGSYASHDLGPELLTGAKVVLLRMPRMLAGLAEIADAIARYASPDVVVFAGGRDKYLTPTMNDVLAQSFSHVQAGRGRQKSRVIVASSPLPVADSQFPVSERLAEIDGDVVAYGAAFSGARLDIGTRFLLEHLDRMAPDAAEAIDLGCGTGILATALAKSRPGIQVIGTDQSAAAVASARATAEANGVGDRVRVVRDDAMSSAADSSADLVLCNPPFHVGAAVHTGSAIKMFAQAGRVLRPGGELWTVYNSHLNYRGIVAQLVGPTDVIGRNKKFTVTRSVREPRSR
ncbi:class I SAM-dependent methyltransferase [Nocardia camponoti]|uniref:16S RNA G1207 methylase RsmC n=1 Tax=Nocardia camponoti TaxID=1616106 RepID=A0A917QGR2_9NOCA|nr:methyltransferase [Nocardia camponoti]GGK48301.1 16S RNA G1207 methylase RsmC [Nocardia camponoti]